MKLVRGDSSVLGPFLESVKGGVSLKKKGRRGVLQARAIQRSIAKGRGGPSVGRGIAQRTVIN